MFKRLFNNSSSKYLANTNDQINVLDNKTYEYWLKILLKLRLTEAQVPHDDQNFPFIYR